MKKIFLLTILLFQFTFVFGQSEWTEYGSWFSNRCFPQIQSRIKVISNPKLNTTGVMVEFKNNYSRKVTFMFAGFNNSIEAEQAFAEKGNLLGGQQSSISLGSGQSSTYTFSIKGSGGNRAHIEIYTLYYDNDYQHYQKCSDGSICLYCQVNNSNEPACPNYSKTSNSSNTQQNDLSEYNRSKADLERQIAEKNAEAQREANRINNQRKQFINVFNEGADLQRSGNFEGAKGKYQQAIGLATNEAERQKAQSSYDNMAKTVKDAVVYNVVGEGLIQIGSTLDKVHNDKMKKIQDEIGDSERKRKIIDEDKVVNTLNNPKIFETYCDYIAKNLEELNFNFEKMYIYNNIPNENKEVFLNFKGLQVIVKNYWNTGINGMMKTIVFKAENENIFKSLDKSNFIVSLKKLYPFYNEKDAKLFKNEISLFTYGLEKTQPFIDVYNNGYKSENYKGFSSLLVDFQNQAKIKLEKTDNSIDDILGKVVLYQYGTQGVEKNYQKALDVSMNAYGNSKDKIFLIKIGDLYKEGDKVLPKNYGKAEEFYLKYLQDNDKINPYVYISLSEIYKDESTSLYNINKAEEVLQKPLKSLEQEFNSEKVEELKSKLSYKISLIYSKLAGLYNDKKNPTLFAENSEKVMQWNEDDYFTASTLVKLYADGKIPYEKDSYGFKSDKKMAKFWAIRLTEIVNRLERKDSGSHNAKSSKVVLDMLKMQYGKFF